MTENTFDKTAHQTKWIPVKNLSVVWAAAQRDFDPRHANNIANEFDPDMFGVLSVSLPNGDGIYHVIDGQHRKEAVQQLFGDAEKVPCNIFDAEDPQRAAEIFDKINTARKAPHAVSRFLIRVTAKATTETAVSDIVRALGFHVTRDTSQRGSIRAVDALLSVYRKFGTGILAKTLQIIRDTWGDHPHATDATLIRGYGAFLAEYHSSIKEDRLISQVQKTYSPGQLMAASKTAQEFNRGSRADGVKLVLVNAYGKGRLSPKKPTNSATNGKLPLEAAASAP